MNEYTSSSSFAAKHCSSLCSQSEGDEFYGEHVAKERVYSGLWHFRDVSVALTLRAK